jgi:hypothetical protein
MGAEAPATHHGENVKIIFAAIMLALSAGAHAQLVKCVSKDGKVEYARDCPAGTTEQKTGIKSAGGGQAGGGSAAPKSLAERDAEFKKRQIEQQETQQKDAKKAAEAEQKRENCESAQLYLKSLEAGQRITRNDPKTGERVFIDDAERAAEITKARGRVDQNCK